MIKKATPKKIEKEPIFQDRERLSRVLFKALKLVDQTNNINEKIDIIRKAIEAEFNLEDK